MRRPRGRRALTVGVVLAIPTLLLGWTVTAVFAAASPAPVAGAAPGAATGDATKGMTTFGSAGCTACHGANLEGGIGPKLNPIQGLGNTPNALDPAYLTKVITEGLSGVGGFPTAMPPKGGNSSLAAADIQDIVAYIIQVNKIPPGKQPLGPVALARSDVFWITVAVFAMVIVTLGLSRYNMRWIERRAAARRERGRSD
ncbi:MAG: cytochrome c [Candidatus Dormibacteraeota bacterium]|nr:cytochrome c [Candidatus Dormibacteraeota bacterium]